MEDIKMHVVLLLNRKRLCALFLFICMCLYNGNLYAKHIVKTSGELGALLSEDKNQGLILLDGGLFHIAGIDVKAGGVVRPYPGRKPVLIGFHQKVEKGNRKIGKKGYWNTQIKGYGSSQIVFLDKDLESIPYACQIDEMDGFDVKADKIQVVNKDERLVRIPLPTNFEYLKNRDKQFLKNFSIKMGYWFVCIELRQIYSDAYYLYATVDNNYNFNLLSIRPYANVRMEFFNLPKEGDGIFLDGNDLLYVPSKYETVYVCTTPPIMKLEGNRELTFEGITFTGANNNAIEISGSNKHFKNCTVRNCGRGVETSKGSYSNCTIKGCLFENLYENCAISLNGIDDVVIEKNTIRHTGTLMKGGQTVSVAGLNFKVVNNNISNFSYIAISVGNTREYKPGTISGIVRGNVVDNAANYDKPKNQLDDGGGIYVITHTDGVEISNNIIRNIGYEDAWMHGIYLDDGAYNVTVKYNLVYNINRNSKAIYARYVDDTERSCMNNIFEGNICIGNCVMAGNKRGVGKKTTVKGNYISGDIENSDDYVIQSGNRVIEAVAQNDTVIKISKRNGLRKWKYSRSIRKIIQF